MSNKLTKPCEIYRCNSTEQLTELLSNNFGRAFQIYVVSTITVNNTAIPAWTVFNVQMPLSDDAFEAIGAQVTTGSMYVLYGNNLENMKARQIS